LTKHDGVKKTSVEELNETSMWRNTVVYGIFRSRVSFACLLWHVSI